MSCTSPNKVFYVGINEESGKKKILFTSRHVDFLYRRSFGEPWQKATGLDPDKAKADGYEVITSCDKVPCGQCMSCRLDYARQWASRCMLEMKKHDPNKCWFVTLTYDEEHLPAAREFLHPVTGEYKLSKFHSVNKKDHQDFMKRLRKEYGQGIRFFMSGEYGDVTYRPHYHYALFGIELNDLEFYKKNWRGEYYWNSPKLREVWKNGEVIVAKLEFDSANYIARYITKKQKGLNADMYEKIGIDPEFCLMSRRPGIGKDYFDKNYEVLYETEEIILPGKNGSVVSRIPRYYDSLLDKISPERMEEIKRDRKERAEEAEEFRHYRTPLVDDEDLFSSRDRRVKNKIILKKKGDF